MKSKHQWRNIEWNILGCGCLTTMSHQFNMLLPNNNIYCRVWDLLCLHGLRTVGATSPSPSGVAGKIAQQFIVCVGANAHGSLGLCSHAWLAWWWGPYHRWPEWLTLDTEMTQSKGMLHVYYENWTMDRNIECTKLNMTKRVHNL